MLNRFNCAFAVCVLRQYWFIDYDFIAHYVRLWTSEHRKTKRPTVGSSSHRKLLRFVFYNFDLGMRFFYSDSNFSVKIHSEILFFLSFQMAREYIQIGVAGSDLFPFLLLPIEYHIPNSIEWRRKSVSERCSRWFFVFRQIAIVDDSSISEYSKVFQSIVPRTVTTSHCHSCWAFMLRWWCSDGGANILVYHGRIRLLCSSAPTSMDWWVWEMVFHFIEFPPPSGGLWGFPQWEKSLRVSIFMLESKWICGWKKKSHSAADECIAWKSNALFVSNSIVHNTNAPIRHEYNCTVYYCVVKTLHWRRGVPLSESAIEFKCIFDFIWWRRQTRILINRIELHTCIKYTCCSDIAQFHFPFDRMNEDVWCDAL